MNFKTKCILLGWILGSSCTASSLDRRMAGGTEVSKEDYPYLVLVTLEDSLMKKKGYRSRAAPEGAQCVGAIISEDTVLTAAHCLPELDPTLYTVTGQINDSRERELDFAIKLRPTKVIPHERFNDPPYNNDIGIMKVQKGHGLKTIELDFSEKKQSGTLTLASWGTDPNNREIQNLRSLDLYAQKDEKCYQADSDYNSEQSICVLGKDEKHMFYRGDSGGPVLNNQRKVVGIISYSPIRDRTQPGVLQSVAYHKNWIKRIAPGVNQYQTPFYSNNNNNNYKPKDNYNDPKKTNGSRHQSPSWYKDHNSQAKDSYNNRNQNRNHINDYQKPNIKDNRNYLSGDYNQNQYQNQYRNRPTIGNQNNQWNSNPYYQPINQQFNHPTQNQASINRNQWKPSPTPYQPPQSQWSPYNKQSTPIVQKPPVKPPQPRWSPYSRQLTPVDQKPPRSQWPTYNRQSSPVDQKPPQSQWPTYNRQSTPVNQKPWEKPKSSTGSYSSFTTPYTSYSHRL